MIRNHLICVLLVGWAVEQALTGWSYAQTSSAARDFSCAAFPRDIGEAGLIAQSGRENVRRGGVVGADDGPQDGTILFPNQESKIEIVWWDGERRKLHWARTREARSPWRSPDGITVGMDLKTLEQRNGSPFRLRWFWEGAPGLVLSWGDGRFKIKNADGCSLQIFLLHPNLKVINPAMNVLNKTEFSSTDPPLQIHNPRVYQMTITHDWR